MITLEVLYYCEETKK